MPDLEKHIELETECNAVHYREKKDSKVLDGELIPCFYAIYIYDCFMYSNVQLPLDVYHITVCFRKAAALDF